MALYDDIALALGPIISMKGRLTSFEQDVFDIALADVKALCDDEDEQEKITADMMLELEQELEDRGGSPRPVDSPHVVTDQPPQKAATTDPS
jgi:hypothetical protein